MNVLLVGLYSALRNKLRTLLTIVGVALAVVAFLLLRTLLDVWTASVADAADDRLTVRPRITFAVPIPLRYAEEVQYLPGVRQVAHITWFGGTYAEHEKESFRSFSVVARDYLPLYDELLVPADQRQRWIETFNGALVGERLAKKFGWKVGDKVLLIAPSYIKPREWRFEISAIYTTSRRSLDAESFIFHYEYMSADLPESKKPMASSIVARVDDPRRVTEVARAIDAHFADSDLPTRTMSERALNISQLGMMSSVLTAVNVVSFVILLIMTLIFGNTIAMGVRERTHEYGVMSALGFKPRQLAGFVLAEALAIGLLGGALGVVASYPLIERGVGRYLEESMGGTFPYVQIDAHTAAVAFVLAVAVGLLAAAPPAYRALRLIAVNALRAD